MSATSSVFHARDFERRYLKPRRAVVVNRSTRLQAVEKFSTEWPAVRALALAGLAVCCVSIAKLILGLF